MNFFHKREIHRLIRGENLDNLKMMLNMMQYTSDDLAHFLFFALGNARYAETTGRDTCSYDDIVEYVFRIYCSEFSSRSLVEFYVSNRSSKELNDVVSVHSRIQYLIDGLSDQDRRDVEGLVFLNA